MGKKGIDIMPDAMLTMGFLVMVVGWAGVLFLLTEICKWLSQTQIKKAAPVLLPVRVRVTPNQNHRPR